MKSHQEQSLEIKNAELEKQLAEKNRDLQIEASLERVRTVAMSMRKPDDLLSICESLFRELQLLDFGDLRNALVHTYSNSNYIIDYDYSDFSKGTINHIPYSGNPNLEEFAEGIRKTKDAFIEEALTGLELENWKKFRNANNEAYDERLDKTQALYYYFYSVGEAAIGISTFVPISAEKLGILKRFRNVFDLAYRRFADIQLAEEQARESKIELAMERVRARTMAMQHSDELSETVYILFQQFKELGENPDQATIGVINEEENVIEYWVTMYGSQINRVFKFPIDEPHVTQKIYQGWKAKKTSLVIDLSGTELYAFTKFRESMGGAKHNPNEKRRVINVAFFSKGLINVQSSEERSAESIRLLERFAGVFDGTYTRFLDLKKAEAQARLAQIELSLERVRAKTMAMHNSEHVGETVLTMFDELVKLGIEKTVRCGILIIDETKHMEVWTAAGDASGKVQMRIGSIDMMIHPLLSGIHEAWKNKEQIRRYDLAGDDLKSYYQSINDSPEYTANFDLENLPERETNYAFLFPEGAIFAFTLSPLRDDEMILFKRFSGVFSQTYRRYLDLQRAEKQARQARIEAALERVRSRSMGMQKSDELKEIIKVVFEQLVQLEIPAEHAGFIMDYPTNEHMNIWLADKHFDPSWVSIPYFDSPHWNSFKDAIANGKDFFVNYLDFEEKNKFYAELFDIVPGVTEEAKAYYLNCQALAVSTVLLENVGLYIENFSGVPFTDEENATLMRFGKVFQQTYTRFLDLQKAEAQAREAIKQASLDRVRGEIASMRSTEDLDRITPLIWNELMILGIPFIRCGVFIIDEEAALIYTHLSTADGKAISTFNLRFDSAGIATQVLTSWRAKQVTTIHWSAEEFADYTQSLVNQGTITSSDKYVTEHPDISLDLHFLPFLQGMLYVGNIEPLTRDEIELVQSLADAFSTAYARYEDFNKLESAKKQVENTLSDLKAAQTKLIQSEKMASLGELTAGIAHEIQNPLNFVNNFSEVNQEILAELKAETEKPISKRDAQLEIELISDLLDNEQKINHHGKRADAIVKGMLQHSRTGGGEKQLININALADEFMRLSYHGLRAKDKIFNSEMVTHFDPDLTKINGIGQDLGRVLLNLFNNAFYAVNQKKKNLGDDYKPEVTVTTLTENGQVVIKVKDNGVGMPEHIKEKIMQPFFTTKPTGEGTGLGLSLTYDMVVKGHGGKIDVNTKEGEFTEFIVSLPI